MNIAVCIKQVPFAYSLRFDVERKTLVRDGVTLVMSSIDRQAMWEALAIRDRLGGKVTVLTMGPPQARDILIDALVSGADRAIHLQDQAFAGADTLATARALALALEKAGPFDLMLCGRFTNDAETGQVGPQVAELLGVPQVTNAQEIAWDEISGFLQVRRETEDGFDNLAVELPVLITAGAWINRPIRPTREEVATARDLPVETWTASDLSSDTTQFGLAGSPTWVGEIQSIPSTRSPIIIDGADPETAAAELVEHLLSRGLFSLWQRAFPTLPPPPPNPDPSQAVWVIAEFLDDKPKSVTLELLGKAAELAHHTNGEVVAVLIGSGLGALAENMAAFGANRVLVADHPQLARYDTDAFTTILSDAIQARKPAIVLVPATVNGRDLAPRVAARLGLGLTGDCVGLEFDGEGLLKQVKPAFGGNIVAPIYSRTTPAMATIRPGVFPRPILDATRSAVIEVLEPSTVEERRVRFVGTTPLEGATGTELDDAEVVVGIGQGIESAEHVPLVAALAEALGGTIAASLKAVENGILASPIQVGMTGRTIAPRFYIAVGVRGYLTHMMGVQRAESIIAINNDAKAEIFKNCDVGVVGDLHQIVPALTQAILRARQALS